MIFHKKTRVFLINQNETSNWKTLYYTSSQGFGPKQVKDVFEVILVDDHESAVRYSRSGQVFEING